MLRPLAAAGFRRPSSPIFNLPFFLMEQLKHKEVPGEFADRLGRADLADCADLADLADLADFATNEGELA